MSDEFIPVEITKVVVTAKSRRVEVRWTLSEKDITAIHVGFGVEEYLGASFFFQRGGLDQVKRAFDQTVQMRIRMLRTMTERLAKIDPNRLNIFYNFVMQTEGRTRLRGMLTTSVRECQPSNS
jgi:hypothetical protein